MTEPLAITSLALRDLRIVRELSLQPCPSLNVVSGENGQGKTTLLEALYLALTSRSFRTERPRELLRTGAESGVVRVRVAEGSLEREQRAVVTARGRAVTLDGKRPATLGSYATRSPVVIFQPGDLGLLAGPAAARRTLLDRVALFLDPASSDHRLRYDRATRGRLAALMARGERAAELPDLEELMATHGAALSVARAAAAARLVDALRPVFARMAGPGLLLEPVFVPGGSVEPEPLRQELARRRARDLAAGRTTHGPHRDDLEILLGGRPVRRHASQGQTRVLTLALKVAELDCIREARGTEPILLLDDVSSELDVARTGAVFDLLVGRKGQIFVTTTRPELVPIGGADGVPRLDFRLADGALAAAPSGA